MRKVFFTIICLFQIIFFPDTSKGSIPKYTIQSIPGNYVFSINDRGQVTGCTNNYECFVWSGEQGIYYPPQFSGSRIYPSYINNSNVIAGNGSNGVVLKNNELINIGSVTWPSAINNNDQVTGTTRNGGFPYDAFIWDSSFGLVRIQGFGGGNSKGFDISDSGIVVGRSETHDPSIGIYHHAFLWQDLNHNNLSDIGETIDLDILKDGIWSEAYSINNSGKVVGVSHVGGDIFNTEAFMWSESEGMISLGDLNLQWGTGNSGGMGMAINDFDQVIFSNDGMDISFYWDPVNGMIDIYNLLPQDSGWSRLSLMDINNNGQIIGRGLFGDLPQCFIMEPIPEPATLLLLGFGTLMLRRRGS
jgi:probable HAF family extracellular repeat protein